MFEEEEEEEDKANIPLYKRYSSIGQLEEGQFGTRHAGSEGNKCDGIDSIFEVDKATKMASNISDDGSAGANEGDRNDKSNVTIGHSCKE